MNNESELDEVRSCDTITGSLNIQGRGITTVELADLERVGEDLAVNVPATLNSVHLPRLVSVGGEAAVLNCDALGSLSGFRALSSVGGDLVIQGNDALAGALGLAALSSVGGGLTVSSNQSLGTLGDLARLTRLSSVSITDNPSLPTCEVSGFVAGLQGLTASPVIFGNDDAATCN